MDGFKVLIVDDQPAVLAALEVLFDVHGFETLVARTPEQALELVRSEQLGVVLQDMNFHRDATSGEEGEALLHAIRKLDPDLPVVLMTAFQSVSLSLSSFSRLCGSSPPPFCCRSSPEPPGRSVPRFAMQHTTSALTVLYWAGVMAFAFPSTLACPLPWPSP